MAKNKQAYFGLHRVWRATFFQLGGPVVSAQAWNNAVGNRGGYQRRTGRAQTWRGASSRSGALGRGRLRKCARLITWNSLGGKSLPERYRVSPKRGSSELDRVLGGVAMVAGSCRVDGAADRAFGKINHSC